MKWISTKKKLPEEGKYVIARHNRGTWYDDTDEDNANCVVVKLVRGLSLEDRKKMAAGEIPSRLIAVRDSRGRHEVEEHKLFGSHDEGECGNTAPYSWKSFGIDEFKSGSITHWRPIKPIAKKYRGSNHSNCENGDED